MEEKNEFTTIEFNKLKAEHYQLMSDNKAKSEKLDRELANNVNLEYLKNIVMSYFMTNDPKVQINLIRVVF
jgi:ABC-type transporter MlaC component